MSHQSRSTRFAPLLAAAVSLAYCVQAALVLRAPQAESGWNAAAYAVEAAFVVALAATLPVLGLLRTHGGRASTAGVWLARAGFGGMLVSAAASLAAGGNTLGPAFVLGLLASLAGLVTLAAASLRHRSGTWWVAPTLAAGLVLGLALADSGGGIVLGIAWAAAALGFRADRAVAAGAAHPRAEAIVQA